MMNNIQNKLRLEMIRGIRYAGWIDSPYRDNHSCMVPIPSIFITRFDDPDYSVNLLNFPTALGGEVNKL